AEREPAPGQERAHARLVLEQPFQLGGGEVGIAHESGGPAERRLAATPAQLVAARRRAPVLPDDGAPERLARPAVPEERGLALVRHADRRQLAGLDTAGPDRSGGGLEDAAPHVVGGVLRPARPRAG